MNSIYLENSFGLYFVQQKTDTFCNQLAISLLQVLDEIFVYVH